MVAIGAGLVGASGCSEVRGRRKIQQANEQYRDGNYKQAVVMFDEAERLIPDFPVLWLNKGQTCKQLIVPGAKTPESLAASKCAISAFKRYKDLRPEDPRGDLLYLQALYDSDEFDTLVKLYEERYRANPKDLDSVMGMTQVYTKWNKVEDALQWYRTAAELRSDNAEAQYGVGVFLYNQLLQKGGGVDAQNFDPRPDPNKPREVKTAPAGAYGDIIGQQREDYAAEGIKFLEKALALRPQYADAMIYLNLLYRQKAFAYFDSPAGIDAVKWQEAIDRAEEWKKKHLDLINAGKPQPAKVVPAPTEEKAAAEAPKEAPAVEKPAPKGKKKGPARKLAKRQGRK